MPLVAARMLPSKRSESRASTRARLLTVGRTAFARKGLAGVSLTEDILRPAGVSVGSFYHQFRDKTDLFLALLQQHTEAFRAMIREAHDPRSGRGPLEMARHSYATVFRVAEENPELFRIFVRERESENKRVRAYLQETHRGWITSLAEDYRRIGLANGQGTTDTATAELTAELISALTTGTILRYLELPAAERGKQRPRLIAGLVHFTLGGVPALTTATSIKKRRT
ncbi:MAG TPA: TetR/AcrR family transcriptional regulator [Candidatus Kryptonia bacterium]|nr:TetR/AcrR family transcriptional regulator [Candidatus Kryptonia bacterium]